MARTPLNAERLTDDQEETERLVTVIKGHAADLLHDVARSREILRKSLSQLRRASSEPVLSLSDVRKS